MTQAISRTATPVVAAMLAVGCWSIAFGATAEEPPATRAATPVTSVPSAAELLSLRTPLSSGVLFSPTLSPPAWSPDGSQIAYLGSVPGNSLGLWSIGPGGGSPHSSSTMSP